ncbi:glycoside hydrolase family 16 protein [Demequina sp.]|uniref:glycoside hydrolase family 16 protein n=1 Tax=Demequina sp. TaxID=2050685 RepID=UPI003A8988BB
MNRRVGLTVIAALVVTGAVAVALAILATEGETAVTATASSTATGTDAQALVDAAAAASPSETSDDATWKADGETASAWVALSWEQPTDVNRVRLDGAAGGRFAAALVMFDDGSAVHVTPDAHGDVLVSFPRRTVTSATVRFIGAVEGVEAVALHAFAVDHGGAEVGAPPASTPAGSPDGVVTPVSADAVADGDIGAGKVGATWDAKRSGATLTYSWPTPVAVAAIQIAGPDVTQPSVGGTIRFSDGSEVAVAGIGSGRQPLTTLAFAPRTVTSVTLELAGAASIGEFVVYGPGTTPAVWPSAGEWTVGAAEASDCDASQAATGDAQGSELALVCPSTGARVGATHTATVIVEAGPGETLTAHAWVPDLVSGAVEVLGRATAGQDGRAAFDLDLSRLHTGPVTVRITSPSASIPLYVHLLNAGGADRTEVGYAPRGLTLQYEDTFDEPLSATWDGAGAVYAATKPAGASGSEFGEAVFVDPAEGRTLLGTWQGTMRLRAEPLDGQDPWGWGRTMASGLLSSTRVGGSGIQAQFGYFEARILAPAGHGTWPAFWMLDTISAVEPEGPSGEVDALELYGHDTSATCHTLHNWPVDAREGAGVHCQANASSDDWAMTWHTYGVRIRPHGADYYVDGALVDSEEGLLRDDLPYYFLINLALGGGWPIDLAPTGDAADMYVDWVRVYT